MYTFAYGFCFTNKNYCNENGHKSSLCKKYNNLLYVKKKYKNVNSAKKEVYT